mmetsp:Transcript_14380/g.23406  ORF Transcript_14380/g.23406 Transcript_14380/m.23406 type:complete len:223 (+) Transcript_14380:99-767(+)
MWKPGDRAPFGKASKKDKKKNKAKKKQQAGGGINAIEGFNKRPSVGKSKQHVKKQKVQEHDDETCLDMPVMSEQAATLLPRSPGRKTQSVGISSSLKNMKFMQRKEESRQVAAAQAERARQIREEKWVIDPSMLETKTGQLECKPLLRAPGGFRGRRSFGAFNPHVEKFEKQVCTILEGEKIAEEIDEAAIDEKEMAGYFSGMGSKRRGAQPSSGKAKKRRH